MVRWIAAVGLGAFLLAPPAGAQTTTVVVCPSLALAQQGQQGQRTASSLPQGCRVVGVRRVDTPAGPYCAVDFGEDGGLMADIMDATVQTRWWAACASLTPP
jgi:hypothetical protein